MIKYAALLVLIMGSSLAHRSELVLHKNQITNPEALNTFFAALRQLEQQEHKQVSIMHIGDSHIQADFMTGVVRKKMQSRFGNAGRGFVFPYKIAKSGGALDIKFTYEGAWNYCNLLNSVNCNVAFSGFTVSSTSSSTFTLDAASRSDGDASFTKLTFFCTNGSFVPTGVSYKFNSNRQNNRNTIYFDVSQDSLVFVPIDLNGSMPELQGLILENEKPGVLYHNVGINGSTLNQYLNGSSFEKQIAELNTNLIIVSFGTNDAYRESSGFCESCIKNQYRAFIARIRKESPNASILLTSPPDHFYNKKSNENAKKIADVLLELSKEQNVAVWNLHDIMGGSNSILDWKNAGLARGDLIHFTKDGYALQGELLYQALVGLYVK